VIELTTGLLYCSQQSDYEASIYYLSLLIILNLLVLQQPGKMSTFKKGIVKLFFLLLIV